MTQSVQRIVTTTYDVKRIGNRTDTLYFVYKNNFSDDLTEYSAERRLDGLLYDLQGGNCDMFTDLDAALDKQDRNWWDNCNIDDYVTPKPAVFEVDLEMAARQVLQVTNREVA